MNAVLTLFASPLQHNLSRNAHIAMLNIATIRMNPRLPSLDHAETVQQQKDVNCILPHGNHHSCLGIFHHLRLIGTKECDSQIRLSQIHIQS